MATLVSKNSGTQAQSSKKKKVKGPTESPAPSVTGSAAPAKAISANPSENQDYENPYLKELAKNVRNANKKLANVAKTESIIAANPTKSLDELVAAKIINIDQKAQILNKPNYVIKLTEAEDQFNHYKKIHSEYLEQRAADKKQLEEMLNEKHKKDLEAAVAEARAKADKKLRESLLSISQFLAVAAARRGEDFDPEEDENKALEGCLLQVYYGNEAGVEAMLKISNASLEKTIGVNGDTLETTYAQVKETAATYAAAIYPSRTDPAQESPLEQPLSSEEALTKATETDLIVSNIVTTRVVSDEDVTVQPADVKEKRVEILNGAPVNASVGDDAANAAGESQWDSPNTIDPSMSQSWVQVPRDPTETETGLEATPAAPVNTQSWSDEVHEAHNKILQSSTPQEPADDGFTAVQRKNPREHRGDGFRGRGRGGRGGRDGFRGRGSRSDHRGRGRGGVSGRRPETT